MNSTEHREQRSAKLTAMSQQQLVDFIIDEEIISSRMLSDAKKALNDAMRHAEKIRLEFAATLDEMKLVDAAALTDENRRLVKEISDLRQELAALSAEAIDLETAVASAVIGNVERLRMKFRMIGEAEINASYKNNRAEDAFHRISSRMSGEDAAFSAVASQAEAMLSVRKEPGSESPRYIPRPGMGRLQERAAELEGQCASLKSALECASIERQHDVQAGLDLLLKDLDSRILAQDDFVHHAEIIRRALRQLGSSGSYYYASKKSDRG